MDLHHKVDIQIQDYIARMAFQFFPEETAQLKKVIDHTRWSACDYNNKDYEGGILFNRIILWKSQPRMHHDLKDFLYAIICAGKFIEGELILSDVKAKFE